MLWPVLKIVVFVALVMLVTLGIAFVTETDIHLRVAMAGWEFTLTPLAWALALVVLLVLVWLALRLGGLALAIYGFLRGDETALTRYFDRNRERKGIAALSDGMIALAAGEGSVARAKAAKAERYLGRGDLTLLLKAQAAEATGDSDAAIEAYKALLGDDRTRFVGVRGLMLQKLAQGDTDRALALAEKAFVLKPRHTEVQDTLFRLQSRRADWAGARRTLAAKLKSRGLPRDVHARRDAVLALADARSKIAEKGLQAGSEAALEANRLSPDLVPAAALAAETLIAAQNPRKAAKLLKTAWAANPHPDLAAAFAAIAPGETPAERRKRFQPLLKLLPDHPETRMLDAELALADEDFPAARRALGDLAMANPSARALTIMAAVERGAGADDRVVRGWLARAVAAPRGARWACTACGHVHSDWAPVCANCESFDTLAWTDPPASMDDRSTAGMLPLIVGAPPATAGEPEAPDVTGERKDAERRPHHDDTEGVVEDAPVLPDDARPRP